MYMHAQYDACVAILKTQTTVLRGPIADLFYFMHMQAVLWCICMCDCVWLSCRQTPVKRQRQFSVDQWQALFYFMHMQALGWLGTLCSVIDYGLPFYMQALLWCICMCDSVWLSHRWSPVKRTTVLHGPIAVFILLHAYASCAVMHMHVCGYPVDGVRWRDDCRTPVLCGRHAASVPLVPAIHPDVWPRHSCT